LCPQYCKMLTGIDSSDLDEQDDGIHNFVSTIVENMLTNVGRASSPAYHNHNLNTDSTFKANGRRWKVLKALMMLDLRLFL
jgi:hypothetical protein